jgi:hypothetical protein
MPWSLFTLKYVEGLMPWIGTTCICIIKMFLRRWSHIVKLKLHSRVKVVKLIKKLILKIDYEVVYDDAMILHDY